MKYVALGALSLFAFPIAVGAQGVQRYLIDFVELFNTTFIPLLIALAVLFFTWNLVRYFIIKSADAEGRQEARRLAFWGVLAFFIIFFIWGIVNLLLFTFDISRDRALCPDYFPISCGRDSSNFGH